MNLRFAIYYLVFCLSLLAGCDQPQAGVRRPATQAASNEDGRQKVGDSTVPNPQSEIRNHATPGSDRPSQLPTGFAPVKIGILPLTELSNPSGTGQRVKLSVFVTMQDGFGSQVKAPGVLRFELYEYIPRSAQPKGQRLAIWPDVDLTGPAENNKFWQDFLRAYEFELDTQASRDKTYILEATCLCSDGKRLSAEYTLRGSQ